MSKHLKDIYHWVVRVSEEMADAEVRAEGLPVCILGNGALFLHVTVADDSLRNAQITEETIAVGGWKTIQEPADWGEYHE